MNNCNPEQIAALMEDGGKKYKIILKSLHSAVERQIQNDRQKWAKYQDSPMYQQQWRIKRLADLEASTQRVIEADAIGFIDSGTLLAGINHGDRTVHMSGVRRRAPNTMKSYLHKIKQVPEFYTLVGHTKPGTSAHDPSHTDYIIKKHYNTILSINIDNIVSINGKPVMGTDVDAGLKALGDTAVE
jgi:hypothetical protein